MNQSSLQKAANSELSSKSLTAAVSRDKMQRKWRYGCTGVPSGLSLSGSFPRCVMGERSYSASRDSGKHRMNEPRAVIETYLAPGVV